MFITRMRLQLRRGSKALFSEERFYCLNCTNLVSWFSGKSSKLLPPDVKVYGQNAPNSISAGTPPQTPLEQLTALPQIHQLDLRRVFLTGRERERREGRDLRISRLHLNRMPNRIGHYDSKSNWISNRIGHNYIPPKASSVFGNYSCREWRLQSPF